MFRMRPGALCALLVPGLLAGLAGNSSAAERPLNQASVSDATGGATARVELWQRDSDGAVYPKVWVSDTKADGICAHAAVQWHHKNGNTYTDYGSWICGAGTSSREPSVKGARNWRDYRSVSIAAFVDNGAPAAAPLYDFMAHPPTAPSGPTVTPVVNTSPAPTPTVPKAPRFGKAIDGYAPENAFGNKKAAKCAEGQARLKPGVRDFRDLLQRTYGSTPGTEYLEGSEGCDRHWGGHDFGLAIDWAYNESEKFNLHAKPLGDAIVKWLLATDRYGHKHALARRLGINMLIWDSEIWTTTRRDEGWRAYRPVVDGKAVDCPKGEGSKKRCHRDHVHFEFGAAGANRRTSWWAGHLGGAGTGHLDGGGSSQGGPR